MVHSGKWFLLSTCPTDKCIQFEISKPGNGLWPSSNKPIPKPMLTDIYVTIIKGLPGDEFTKN